MSASQTGARSSSLTHIVGKRAQPNANHPPQLSQMMRAIHAEGKMPTPDIPAQLVTSIVLSEDSSINGQVIDLRSEQGQQLTKGTIVSQQ